MRILDIGCGNRKTEGAVGIDLNYDTDHTMDLDTEDIPYPDGHFSKVVSNDSIEHFGNPKHVFKEVYRVLEPGGVFRIKTVNVNVWWIKVASMFRDHNKAWRHKIGTKRTGHLTHWTPDMLRMWFELNGFDVIEDRSNFLLMYSITMTGRKPDADESYDGRVLR